MSDYDLGTARGRIEIDYNGNGVRDADRSLHGLGGTVSSTGDALGKVSNVAGGAGLAIAGGLAVAVKGAADFEQGLSNIKAVSGATAGEMENIRQKALQIGKDTTFGASDASQAMEELAKAGLSTSDILNGAADATVALAAAGEVDLPFAAEIASNALNQFSLKAKDLPNVADKIAGAANASAISVEDFGYSLSQVGAVANLAGLSFDDTAIAIAEMGNAGIKGSDAGTSLKTMLSNLQPTTDKAKSALEGLGIITKDGTNLFYDQTGKLKSLKDIQALLAKGTEGMTSAQKQATLQTIFGSDAIRAAAILTKSGAAGYDKMATAIGKVKAADVAKTKMDNLNGSIEAFKGSAETLGIQLGTVLLPTLRDIVDSVSGLLNGFLSLSDGQQKAIVLVLAGAAGFLLFASATIKVVGIIREFVAIMRVLSAAMQIGPILTMLRMTFLGLSTAVRGFGIALYTALGPIGLIILAVVAIIAILVLLYNKNETVRKIIQAVWAAIKTAVGNTVDWFVNTAGPAIMNVLTAVGNYFKGFWNTVKTVWNGIKSTISFVVNAIKTLIVSYFNLYVTIIRTAFNAIKSVITTVFNAVKTFIGNVVTAIKTIISTAVNGWKTVISTAMNAALAIVRSVWNSITGKIRSAVNTAMSVVRGIKSTVRGIFSGAGSWLLQAGRNIIAGLINGIKGMLGSLRNQLSSVTGLIPDWKGPPKRDKVLLEQNGELIMQGLLNGIGNQVGPLRNLLQGVTGNIPTWASRAIASRSAVQPTNTSELSTAVQSGVTVNNFNPVAEPSSVTTTRSMTRLAQLGVLG